MGWLANPVIAVFQRAFGVRACRIDVIGEHHAMPDENFVLQRDTFANETMRGNLAARTDLATRLNFYKGADPAILTDPASINVYEVGMGNRNVAPDSAVQDWQLRTPMLDIAVLLWRVVRNVVLDPKMTNRAPLENRAFGRNLEWFERRDIGEITESASTYRLFYVKPL